MPSPVEVRIDRYVATAPRETVDADIEAIFFETAGPRTFGSDMERSAFRERWLSRYLDRFPDEAFVARDPLGKAVGYLVGCLDDPVRQPLFADIPYFADFAHLTAKFPAHLHINLTAACRGAGIGHRLIEAFAAHAAAKGVPGMHAITADGVRNNGFYRDCGFARAGTVLWNGKPIVFFARPLPAPANGVTS